MPPNPFTPELVSLVHETLGKWRCPGAAFSVIHGDETWSKGFGEAQLEPSQPVEPTTLFYAASTTKAQLCAAWSISISSEQNQSKGDAKVTFATPLTDIIRDDFVLADPTRTLQVTLEDAVSHRSGMSRHELSYGREGVETVKTITRNLRHLPLHNTVRTHYEYCNTMFMAASHALEVVTGQTVGRLLRETLWEPLGMTQTYAGYADASIAMQEKGEVLAKSYTWSKSPADPDAESGSYRDHGHMNKLDCVSGAGYVISTADDYAKWMRCLVRSSTPLSPAITKDLWTPRITADPGYYQPAADGDAVSYCLGWFKYVYRDKTVLCHPGGIVGAGSMIMVVPELQWGATFLANGEDPGARLQGLLLELLDTAMDIPASERSARKIVDERVLAFCRSKFAERNDATAKLFPSAPQKPNVLPGLAIAEYAGTYWNAGYGPITFTVSQQREQALECKFRDRTWPVTWRLQHVNAEHWVIETLDVNIADVRKAESKISVAGKADLFGIAMESEMPDCLIWFKRIS